MPRRGLVVCGQTGELHAFPNRCPDLGHRRLDLLPGVDKTRCCSIGQPLFDYRGGKLLGAATKPLKAMGIELDGNKLLVSLQQSSYRFSYARRIS